MRQAALRRLGRVLRGAAVVPDERVTQRPAVGDVQHAVVDAVDAEVGDGLGAAVAAAEVGAGEDRDGAEDRGAGAGDRVAHRAAVAPAEREELRWCRRRGRPRPAWSDRRRGSGPGRWCWPSRCRCPGARRRSCCCSTAASARRRPRRRRPRPPVATSLAVPFSQCRPKISRYGWVLVVVAGDAQDVGAVLAAALDRVRAAGQRGGLAASGGGRREGAAGRGGRRGPLGADYCGTQNYNRGGCCDQRRPRAG